MAHKCERCDKIIEAILVALWLGFALWANFVLYYLNRIVELLEALK